MSEFEPETEPTTEVDPADGIYEGDAVEVLEEEETNPVEDFVDAERIEDLDDSEDRGEPQPS